MSDTDGVLAVLLLLLGVWGLLLSLTELRASRADDDWRRQHHLNGIGALVAADAVQQEVKRSGRMVLYGVVAVVILCGWTKDIGRAALCLALLLDAWTVLRKSRVRRAIRRIELERLGAVVGLREEGE